MKRSFVIRAVFMAVLFLFVLGVTAGSIEMKMARSEKIAIVESSSASGDNPALAGQAREMESILARLPKAIGTESGDIAPINPAVLFARMGEDLENARTAAERKKAGSQDEALSLKPFPEMLVWGVVMRPHPQITVLATVGEGQQVLRTLGIGDLMMGWSLKSVDEREAVFDLDGTEKFVAVAQNIQDRQEATKKYLDYMKTLREGQAPEEPALPAGRGNGLLPASLTGGAEGPAPSGLRMTAPGSGSAGQVPGPGKQSQIPGTGSLAPGVQTVIQQAVGPQAPLFIPAPSQDVPPAGRVTVTKPKGK